MKGRLLFVLLISLLFVSCGDRLCRDKKNRYDRVMILYSAGCNSLSGDLEDNIEELKTGFVPAKKDKRALVVVSHLANGYLSYRPETESYVIRLYKDKTGVVADTLKTIPAGKFLTQPSVMKETLQYVKDNFKSDHYGMVFSSHATGWLPEGYYNNPVSNPSASSATMQAPRRSLDLPEGSVLYYEPENVPGMPLTKSIGQEDTYSGDTKISYEMKQTDFVANIPMHLDYIVFDACLMGCIETAYEFRGVCDKVAFSPAEVLQYGFQYKTLASHLLEGEPDMYKACKDFFDKYDKQTGVMRSATITLVDCTKLDKVASLCKDYFSRYRSQIAGVYPSQVQRYFRSYHHWFYDLEDILIKAGITDSEKNSLEQALDQCILYKAATPTFLLPSATSVGTNDGIRIDVYSGFSMYLPCNGSAYLDEFYKTLAWNKATGLVQ